MTIAQLKAWPEDWPRYKQGKEVCDMLVGPCACGAWHHEGEFTIDHIHPFSHTLGPALYRNGQVVMDAIEHEERR